MIGGKYKDGYIHAFTDHFSTFGLFHPEVVMKSGQEPNNDTIEKLKVEINGKSNETLKNGQLPKTAGKNYNFILIGTIILFLGVMIQMWCRYFQTN